MQGITTCREIRTCSLSDVQGPLVKNAADSIVESSSHWMRGGTSSALRRRQFCSDALSFITGHAMVVEGGQTSDGP